MKKNKVGRPKIGLDVLPEGWHMQVLSLYNEGASDVEIKAYIYNEIGTFSNNLWERWMEEEAEFWETIKKGRLLSEAWWSGTGRKNLENKDFSYTGWYMNMKNRFGWTDRVDNTTKGEKVNTTNYNLKGLSDKELSVLLKLHDRNASNTDKE